MKVLNAVKVKALGQNCGARNEGSGKAVARRASDEMETVRVGGCVGEGEHSQAAFVQPGHLVGINKQDKLMIPSQIP